MKELALRRQKAGIDGLAKGAALNIIAHKTLQKTSSIPTADGHDGAVGQQ